MLLILSSARVDAATVAKIGNKSYSSISKAISVVKNGQTIQIIKNTKWKVPAGGSPEIKNKKVTMDLNGHTVITGKTWKRHVKQESHFRK